MLFELVKGQQVMADMLHTALPFQVGFKTFSCCIVQLREILDPFHDHEVDHTGFIADLYPGGFRFQSGSKRLIILFCCYLPERSRRHSGSPPLTADP